MSEIKFNFYVPDSEIPVKGQYLLILFHLDVREFCHMLKQNSDYSEDQDQ